MFSGYSKNLHAFAPRSHNVARDHRRQVLIGFTIHRMHKNLRKNHAMNQAMKQGILHAAQRNSY